MALKAQNVIETPTHSTPIDSLPLYSAQDAFSDCQCAAVVAPHPDDETLGCGGAIALLNQCHIPVHILVMSDGTQSHPHSKSHPASRLRQLREAETYEAARRLGVPADRVTFLRWPDTAVPQQESELFVKAVERCDRYLTQHSPDLVFTAWRHDQHCDHQATANIVRHCLQSWRKPPRQLAYAIWGSANAGLANLPLGETGWRLDIHTVQALKRHAVMAHQSQTTDLIADDPDGFCLTPTMLNNLIQPWETYLETTPCHHLSL